MKMKKLTLLIFLVLLINVKIKAEDADDQDTKDIEEYEYDDEEHYNEEDHDKEHQEEEENEEEDDEKDGKHIEVIEPFKGWALSPWNWWKGGNSISNLNTDEKGHKTGFTTIYWDCCLPSCSWNENTNSDRPVKACKKDGFTLITDELWKHKNVCEDDGNAYVCNDQKPIVVNETLSFGFVASHEPCCSCHRLKFTTGKAKGKEMIVQVTNTGEDIESNHFDIQVPGGGVGIFNGCTKQWDAPVDGWGKRYGGVDTIDDCSQLPEELRAGCEWRFDWFQNADNPFVTYERVKCPEEIVKITNCVLPDDDQQKN